MEKTFFKLKINIQDLDKYGYPDADACSLIYLSEIIIEENKTSIKIFYPDKEHVGDKLADWFDNNKEDMLKHFEFVETIQPKKVVSIDFTGFRLNGIANGSNYNEQFSSNEPELRYVIINTSGIRISFSNVVDKPSQFYLNQTGFSLVEMNYKYPINFPWNEKPFSWEPKNKIEEYIKFDKIEFKLEHRFYNTTKYESSHISIQKEPMLLVKHEGLSEVEIRKQVTMICALFSFYIHNDVDYYGARINTKNGSFYEQNKKKSIESDGHGIFIWDFHLNPLNLIVNVNASRLMANYTFVLDTIKRFNYAMQLSGESKFMILYNVLEQIRVQYILEKKIELEKAGDPPNLKKVIEEYEFTESKKDTDKNIKVALEDITKIIKEHQKEDFRKEISTKVDNIKLMSMSNQFKSLFDYTKTEPSICNLDFDMVKKLRNKIFHGKPIDDQETECLERISNYDRFPRFVGIMILKYFGIDDLKEVQKKYDN
ncbi:MAG: hypothetical protein V4580_19340 [Bacteroidota bacterium]